MSTPRRADGYVVAGLIALASVPVVAGLARLAQLASGGPITGQSARFFDAPIPVVVHIVSVTIYSLLGAFQFAPGFRSRRPS